MKTVRYIQNTFIRDQIIVGKCNEAIREDALKNKWDLANLTQNGRTIESSAVALTEIKPDLKFDVNKAGKYSKRSKDSKRYTKAKFTCWKCEKVPCSGHDKCEYSNKKCPKCKKYLAPAMTSVNIVIKSVRNAKSTLLRP